MHVPMQRRTLSSCLLLLLSELILVGCSRNVPSFTVSPVPRPNAAPTISVSPAAVTPGQSATLTWSSAYANSCTASGAWSGTLATSGSTTVILNGSAAQVYGIYCFGDDIPGSAFATLSLSPSLGGCAAKSAKKGHARTHRISGSHA